MLSYLFASPITLIQGAIIGLIIGFIFQKSQLSYFHVIINQLLLKDFTVIKVMLTAIVVGSIGIYVILDLGLPIKLFISPISLLAVCIGSSIFGIGMAILGYCPGTCIAAAGQGSRDAWWGIVGMLCGAFAFALSYEFIKAKILPLHIIKNPSLQQLFGVSHWTIIIFLTTISIIFFKVMAYKKIK